MIYDVAVIGGGPAGYTAAEKCAAKGKKVILFEKNNLGGVCLNEGCIPTKTILYSAKIYDGLKTATKYGISVGENTAIDLPKIIARKQKIVRKLVAGIKQKMQEHGVVVEMGEAKLIGKDVDTDSIDIDCDGIVFKATKVLLCTGSQALVPPIPGLSEREYWTSKEVLSNKELPHSLVIIGGGVIGIEFASFFNSLGVKVVVVEMLPEILGVMDKELSALLREEYTKRGVEFHLATKVVEIGETFIIAEKEGKRFNIDTDKILLSIGRQPIVDKASFDSLDIEMYGRGVKVNQYMQTSHLSIYACGDITGSSMLAHTAIREAEVATNHILGVADVMSYKAIPGVVYTNPEVAGVGATEEELIKHKIEHSVIKLPMAYSGRFVVENEMANGLCKLTVGADEKIIGCHMLGNPASELIVIAGIAIEKGYTVDEFQKIVFPHPTVGEIFHELLFSQGDKG